MLAKLIALTIPLCLDSFLIAAAIGLTRPSRSRRVQIGLFFATFEAGMPLVGLAAGALLSGPLGSMAQLVAIGILIGFGLYTTFHDKDEDDEARRIASTHGLAIIGLGLGIGIDGLAIGFTYGLIKVPIVPVTLLIAGQAFILSQLGFSLGSRLPARIRHCGDQAAGVALVAIGVILLVEKLQGH